MIATSASALLFDLDGVLIDSSPAVERVWRQWATERSLDPKKVVAHAHGRPSRSTVWEFLPNADQEKENREVEWREIEDVEGIVVLPGACELLDQIPLHRWTIVTSCTRQLAEVRLRAARLPIPEQMITATDVTQAKPHPEPFLKAAARLGFPASECIVLEDAPAGVRAGKAAGARVIGLFTTFSEVELRMTEPDFVVKNCAAIHAESAANELILTLSE